MDSYVVLLTALIALLAGLAIGKAWERYKLRDGRWIDRRRARESPHYMLGLNFLVTNQTEPAIDELTRASAAAGDPLEIQLILGNLYREKGQVGRAIQEHQKLLQRPDLRKLEHANVLLCLGLDYKQGGFVDRALEAFTEVLRLDPDNQHALSNLEKLYEEQHQWAEAYATRHKLARHDTGTSHARHQEILAFLENELGLDALKRMDYADAARRFDAAIDLDDRTVPAYLNLGDVRFYQGDAAGAIAGVGAPDRQVPRTRVPGVRPSRGRVPESERRGPLSRPVPPPDRSQPAGLARPAGTGPAPVVTRRGARKPSKSCSKRSCTTPTRSRSIRRSGTRSPRSTCRRTLVTRYIDLTRDAVFYLDPHICIRCRYRSTELLWQCPQCHEWNTFIEERIAPAKESLKSDV